MTQDQTSYVEHKQYADDKAYIKQEIETLEVKLAYQEDTIESLNQIVIEQQSKIKHLEKQMELMIEKMKSARSSGDGISNEIERPPHY
jgi:SlyX protein